MLDEVKVRERKSAKHGKTYEYRFEIAKVDGERKWCSSGIERTGVHRFRHTFAKKWVTMGGSVVTLQKILGHSSLAITENYLNVLTSDIQKDIEKVNIIRSLKQERVRMRA